MLPLSAVTGNQFRHFDKHEQNPTINSIRNIAPKPHPPTAQQPGLSGLSEVSWQPTQVYCETISSPD